MKTSQLYVVALAILLACASLAGGTTAIDNRGGSRKPVLPAQAVKWPAEQSATKTLSGEHPALPPDYLKSIGKDIAIFKSSVTAPFTLDPPPGFEGRRNSDICRHLKPEQKKKNPLCN